MGLKALLVLGVAIALVGPMDAAAAPEYTDWSTPVNMGSTVNSNVTDQGPALSKDGLSLYITTSRPGGSGGNDLWVSQRDSEDDSWGSPVNLGSTVNSASLDGAPSFSRDGHWMFFNSERAGGEGALDIWCSYRSDTHDDFDWEAPFNLGPNINGDSTDGGATYFENEDGDARQLFFGGTRSTGLGGTDVYMSTLQSDGTWGEAVLVEELSSSALDQRPSIRHDGLEMFITSNRPGGLGNLDMWVSTRASTSDDWGTPVNLEEVNGASGDSQAFISSDRETLILVSNRAGGSGNTDLWISTREKANGNQ